MAKFIYPMQNLLELKGKLEEQKKADFGRAKSKLMQEQELLEHYQNQKKRYQNELVHCFSSILDIVDIKEKEMALKIVQQKIEHQSIVVKQAERQVELARVLLTEAMKERKTHEKLREKAFEQFKEDVLKEENKEVDELVSFNYGKAKGV